MGYTFSQPGLGGPPPPPPDIPDSPVKPGNDVKKDSGNDIKTGKVLIIDDDEAARYLLTTYLSDMPFRIIEAEKGWEGLRLAHEEKPQMVLLDLIMPGMDGFAVLKNLKADPDTRGIPVIVMTSKILNAEEQHQLAADALAVFNKETTNRMEVVEAVKEALNKQETEFRIQETE
jgi:CheY-like chemotaxis protein